MEPVENTLAQWKTIYDQLQIARAKRGDAFKRQGAVRELDELDAEVQRLQKAADAALNAHYRAMPGRKA